MATKEWDDLDFEEEEEILCPNCGQDTEGEMICPQCGAVLGNEDDMDVFEDDDDSEDA